MGSSLGRHHLLLDLDYENIGDCVKYRKKPIIVEAIQFHKMGDHPEVIEHYWDGDSFRWSNGDRSIDVYGCKKLPSLKTLEGWYKVTPGDWIIKGIKGEFYPCKPDIFELTYEKVEE